MSAAIAVPLIGQRVRAYFAPVNRVTQTPTLFDPAQSGSWNSNAPAAPWIDLGWVTGFTRQSESVMGAVETGSPQTLQMQTREKLGARVSFQLATWSKLTMALATGSQHMNVLAAATNAGAIGSGAKAIAAVPLLANSSATVLYVSGGSLGAGSMVVVDQDYAGQTGFVGSPVSAAYVKSATSVGDDPDYVRRVSFNVGRVIAVGSDGGLQLASPLPGGVPASGMKVQQVVGLVDREGGAFVQEWSALFVVDGMQGDRMFFHYPRLQSSASASEKSVALSDTFEMVQPIAQCVALPVVDGNDGEQVVCYRTYVPNAAALI
jgi:hypothetical protein